MNVIETLFNRIYFSIYSLLFFTNRFVLGKVFEILVYRPLYLIPWVRRRLEKFGLDYKSWINVSDSYLDNPQYGLLNWLLGFIFSYIITSPFFLAVVILELLFGQGFRDFIVQNLGIIVFVIMASSFYLYNRFVLKDDRYLQYYEKFKKEGKKSVIVWSLSVLVYGCVFAIVFFYSFRFAEMKLGYWH